MQGTEQKKGYFQLGRLPTKFSDSAHRFNQFYHFSYIRTSLYQNNQLLVTKPFSKILVICHPLEVK